MLEVLNLPLEIFFLVLPADLCITYFRFVDLFLCLVIRVTEQLPEVLVVIQSFATWHLFGFNPASPSPSGQGSMVDPILLFVLSYKMQIDGRGMISIIYFKETQKEQNIDHNHDRALERIKLWNNSRTVPEIFRNTLQNSRFDQLLPLVLDVTYGV